MWFIGLSFHLWHFKGSHTTHDLLEIFLALSMEGLLSDSLTNLMMVNAACIFLTCYVCIHMKIDYPKSTNGPPLATFRKKELLSFDWILQCPMRDLRG